MKLRENLYVVLLAVLASALCPRASSRVTAPLPRDLHSSSQSRFYPWFGCPRGQSAPPSAHPILLRICRPPSPIRDAPHAVAMNNYTLHAAAMDTCSCRRDHPLEPPYSHPEDSSFTVCRNSLCSSRLGFDDDCGSGSAQAAAPIPSASTPRPCPSHAAIHNSLAAAPAPPAPTPPLPFSALVASSLDHRRNYWLPSTLITSHNRMPLSIPQQ